MRMKAVSGKDCEASKRVKRVYVFYSEFLSQGKSEKIVTQKFIIPKLFNIDNILTIECLNATLNVLRFETERG